MLYHGSLAVRTLRLSPTKNAREIAAICNTEYIETFVASVCISDTGIELEKRVDCSGLPCITDERFPDICTVSV